MTQVSIERLRQVLRYDHEAGKFYQLESRKSGFIPGSEVGFINVQGYTCVSVDGFQLRCNRVAWALHHGEWPATHVDHISRDKTDNRMTNLRLATPSESTVNTLKVSATGRRGVRMCKDKYQAQIKIGGKLICLGTFAALDEAAHAYNKAAIRHHGEFAILNPVGSASH